MTDSRYPSPEAAEAAFYDAFERKDLEAMMGVWADDEHIECIHPMGERLLGVEAVRDSWQRIFADALKLSFRITDRRIHRDTILAIHVVHENIITTLHEGPHPPVIATNIYRHTPHGWRMILHHASPSPARAKRSTDRTPTRQVH